MFSNKYFLSENQPRRTAVGRILEKTSLVDIILRYHFVSSCYEFILSYISFYFYLFPGILEFWYLATVTFNFTVLHNNIYRKKIIYF